MNKEEIIKELENIKEFRCLPEVKEKLLNELQMFLSKTSYPNEFQEGLKCFIRLIKRGKLMTVNSEKICFFVGGISVEYVFNAEKSIDINYRKCYIKDLRNVVSEIVKNRRRCDVLRYGIEIEWCAEVNGTLLKCDGLLSRLWRVCNSSQSGYDGAGSHIWEFRSKPSNRVDDIIQEIRAVNNVFSNFIKEIKRSKIISSILSNTTNNKVKIHTNRVSCGFHITIHSKKINIAWLDLLARYWNSINRKIDLRSKNRYNCGYGWKSHSRNKNTDFPCKRHITVEYRVFTAPDISNKKEVELFINEVLLRLEKHLYDNYCNELTTDEIIKMPYQKVLDLINK